MDITGKTLLAESWYFNEADGYTEHIDISKLAIGTYFVRLSSSNKTEIKKGSIMLSNIAV